LYISNVREKQPEFAFVTFIVNALYFKLQRSKEWKLNRASKSCIITTLIPSVVNKKKM